MGRANEAAWQEPAWVCVSCGFVNLAVRQRCRNFDCGRSKLDTLIAEKVKRWEAAGIAQWGYRRGGDV